MWHKEKHAELNVKRAEALESVKVENKKLTEKGVVRYKKDVKEVEESIERAKEKERELAIQSHLRLK